MQGPSEGRPRRAAIVFVWVTVMLDMVALGLVVPVVPPLVKGLLGGDTARAAEIIGVFGTAWALMQFLAMPLLGRLSDAYGRRPVILLSNLGLGLDHLLMALAPSLGWLFVGRIISGITAASVTTASAYIADVTPPERRAAGFGMLSAAFGVGFVIGPAMGGYLVELGPRLPFWVAAGLSLANALWGLLVLPESLPREQRRPFDWRQATPVRSTGILASSPRLLRLSLLHFLVNLAHVVLPSTAVLYAGYRYGWRDRDVGLMLAGIGVSSVVVQGFLVGKVIALVGDRRALLFGLVAVGLGFGCYGLAPTGALFLLGVPLMAIGGVAGSAAQGLMSRSVAPTEQGALQGALSAVQAFAGMLGPALFAFTFAQAIGRYRAAGVPGAAFLLAAGLLVLALGVALQLPADEAPATPA